MEPDDERRTDSEWSPGFFGRDKHRVVRIGGDSETIDRQMDRLPLNRMPLCDINQHGRSLSETLPDSGAP